MADLDLRLAAAKAVALEAGQLARRRFLGRRPGDYTLKGHQDFLTEVDGEVERFIVEALAKLFPRDGFLGEEGGPQAQSGAGDGTWIIDPIDGTANFARGITHFCISIGYFRAGRPEVGVIVAPMRDEIYAGAIGRGATLNGVPLAAATTARLDEASVELGWNTRRTTADYLKLLHPLLDAGLSVRRLGSGALGSSMSRSGAAMATSRRTSTPGMSPPPWSSPPRQAPACRTSSPRMVWRVAMRSWLPPRRSPPTCRG